MKEYRDKFGEMQSLELKKKRSRLHTEEEKRKISEGNREDRLANSEIELMKIYTERRRVIFLNWTEV